MKYRAVAVILLILVAFIASPVIVNMIKGPADTPVMFKAGYSLEEAREQSYLTGKPVLILVTADWCAPCQALKRGALSDPTVTQWVNENMIPVYLEDGANQDEIRLLPVKAYPTTMVLVDGKLQGHFTGNVSAPGFLSKVRDLVSKS